MKLIKIQKKIENLRVKDEKICPPNFKIKKQNWFRLLLAKIFGTYTVGVDYATSSDNCIKVEGYILRGKTYITKITNSSREQEENQ